MQVVSGEIENRASIRHEDRHVPGQSSERRRQLAVRRVVDQHRTHAITQVFQNPRDDQPSFGDEQTLRPQPLGVRNVAKGRDPGIARVLRSVRSSFRAIGVLTLPTDDGIVVVMTTDEYLYGTEETNRKRELTFGTVCEPPAPFFSHQELVLRVARLLCSHVEPLGLGKVAVAPVDVILDRERALIVQPDVLFISQERLSIVRDQVWGAPDLVVEVLSNRHSAPRPSRKARLVSTVRRP